MLFCFIVKAITGSGHYCVFGLDNSFSHMVLPNQELMEPDEKGRRRAPLVARQHPLK